MPELIELIAFDVPTDFSDVEWLGILAVAMILLSLLLSPQSTLLRSLIAGLWFCLAVRYLAWRIDTLPNVALETATTSIWQVGFFLLEALSMTGAALTWLFQARYVDRSAEATRLAGQMGREPMVDVFIPTYNESRDILERTLCGATALAYGRYRVWLLDDGRRDTIRTLAEDFGVGYLRRSDSAHAKAGNMNNGLQHVLTLDEPPELIAILDADFVPTPQFLSRTVPFFQRDDVGLVQTPQHFFNPDPLQVNLKAERQLADDQRFAQGVDLPARDAWGVATSCGTSSVVRVSSLLSIGGFPTESVCEDTLTSVKFWTLGQKTIFLNEILTQGLAVEGLGELLGQRGRWSLGNMQIVRSAWGPLSRHSMPVLGRLFLSSLMIGALVSPIMRVLIILSPALYLFFGLLPVTVDVSEVFHYLGPLLFVHYVGMAWISRGACLPILNEAITTVEYFSTFRAALVGLLKPMGHKFKVTAKGVERTAYVFHWQLMIPLSLPLALYAIGIYLNLIRFPLNVDNPETMLFTCCWCYYNAAMLIVAIFLCVDLPRSPHVDLFHIDHAATLLVDGEARPVAVKALSPNAAVIAGTGFQDLGPDRLLMLRLDDDLHLPVRAQSAEKGNLVLSLEADVQTRRRLITRLFSGEVVNSVHVSESLGALLVALMRPLRV
ncbi:MAG: glycosyltransferase [Rhizobium sp.]|nr:glycosyltransferase [Rhizobium sp.]